MARVLDKIVEEIQQIQAIARHNKDATRPRWPMIVLKSPKGWTGPKCVDGVPIEDTFRAHQVPLLIDARHPEHLAQLESWMRSYRPEEPFDEKGRLVAELAELAPQGDRRMGANPHGLSTEAFDALFTRDKPIIFAFHGYPSLVHQLTYRRTNHGNMHVRGYKEEGSITTTFDMTVLNDLDRFHLVIDTINRVPKTGDKGAELKQMLLDKLVEHKQYIDQEGEDIPEIRDWKWSV